MPPSYRIHRLLGRGGFGRVYQASTTGPTGEQLVVALKLVDPDRITEASLAELRTEARIAALLRDPLVVATEAPFLLQGRWAVQMAYVDGASLHRVLSEHGRIPPRPAVDIAWRLLDGLARLVTLRGPHGPLNFIHHDIKPGNVQLTPLGAVRLLDFGTSFVEGLGLAHAASPEDVVGTPGFIAPERFRCIDDPKGDVYSVGVLLHRMVAGSMPSEPPPTDPALADALELASWLRTGKLDERPTAAEAEQQLATLHRRMPGPSLADWAGTARPVPRGLPPDDLVGQVLQTTEHEMPLVPARTRPRTLTPSSEPVADVAPGNPFGPALQAPRPPNRPSEPGAPPEVASTSPPTGPPWLLLLAVAAAFVVFVLSGCGVALLGWALL